MNTACFVMASAYRRMCSYPFYTIARKNPKLKARWKKHNAVVFAERQNTPEAIDDVDSEAEDHGLPGYRYFDLLR